MRLSTKEGYLKSKGVRGILTLYIMERLSKEPLSGYDLISDINSLTAGSWRPGPGSVYPIIKELEDKGMIKLASVGERSRKAYTLTIKGQKALEQARNLFDLYSKRYSSLRGLIMDLTSPKLLAEQIEDFLKRLPSIWGRIIESEEIEENDKILILKEHRLLLETQLNWLTSRLKGFDEKMVSAA